MKRTTDSRSAAAKVASDERATNPRVRCAIYTRKSTDENLDNDFNSLDAQREAAELYIRSQACEGWLALPERYDDGACSGATIERPALQRLLADVAAGRVDTIVVYKIDRFSRSLLDFTKLVEVLEAKHVSLVAVTQQFNTTTSMGRLTLNILLSFAQYEREVIADRIRDKVGAARRRGKYLGGIPPLGYSVDHERKRLVVDPVESTLVRTIFLRYRELGSIVALVRELNGKGVRTKSWTTRDGRVREGVPWHKGNMVKLLHNPLYIGLVRHHDQTYAGEQEAIIEQSLWDEVQASLAGNSRQRDSAARGSQPALLKGILRCGHCDAPMGLTFTRSDGRTYRYYTCHRTSNQSATDCPVRSLPARVVEGAAIEQLREVFRAPQVVTETMGLADAGPVVGALTSLDPIWENLFPAEQERLVLLLVEKMVVYPDRLEMVLSRNGLRSLVAEMDEEGGGHAPVHLVA